MDKLKLRNYRDAELEIEQLEELLSRIESKITSAKVASFSNMPIGKGGKKDVIGANLARLEALRALYNRRWDALIAARIEIEESIENLAPAERSLIRYRYIEGLEWEEVAQKMRYSISKTTRMHGKILEKII